MKRINDNNEIINKKLNSNYNEKFFHEVENR